MQPPPQLIFELFNGISERDLNSHKYLVYAHVCPDGMYIGVSDDPVKRWQEHWSDAFNVHCENYTDHFRVAIRANPSSFRHLILQVDNNDKSARNKEARAIKFYGASLNVRPETNYDFSDFGYQALEHQMPVRIILSKKGSSGAWYSRGDGDRTPVIAQIIMERGRKRLRSVGCQNFESGLMVECSREERDKFQEGDLVSVNVAISSKNGKKYLVAAKTGSLRLHRK